MVGMEPLGVVAVVLTAVAVGTAAVLVVRPTRRLAGRIRPYTVAARTSLGRSADVRAVAAPGRHEGTLMRLVGPVLERAATRIGTRLGASADERLLLKLRQADLLPDVPDHRRVVEYRMRELATATGGAGAGTVVGLVLGLSPVAVIGLALLGLVVGATRWRARLDRTIEERRARMRIELYTVNQLLALNVRVGGGIVQAVRRVVDRGNGVLVDELREVLRLHESGVPAADALSRAADLTPEPQVARTYRLLAAGAEHGADLAEALLDHSEDVRESRRETLRRDATKRRAAMLVPIIAVLAPVMLLFIVAPLPSIVFGVQ